MKKNYQLEAITMNKMMWGIVLVVSFIFTLSSISAFSVYDSYPDTNLNWTLWTNTTSVSGGGAISITQSANNYIEVGTTSSANPSSAVYKITSDIMPLYKNIKNITVRILLNPTTSGSNSGASSSATFNLFDGFVRTLNSGSPVNENPSEDVVWSAIRNFTYISNYTFDLYRSGVYNTSFNASNSNLFINSLSSIGGNSVSSSTTSRIYKVQYDLIETNITHEQRVYETSTATFTLSLNITDGQIISSPVFYYNGVSKTATVNNIGGNNYTIISSFEVPTVTNPTIYEGNFNYTINGINYGSLSVYQEVEPFNMVLCNATYNNAYLNITFKNETTNEENVRAKITTSSYYYSLTSGGTTQTYTFANNSAENPSYLFCFTKPISTVYVTPDIFYYNSESSQRSYSPSELTLTSSMTTKTLYLLPTNQGQSVTIQIINPAQQSISGATISVSSSLGVVQSGTTDSAGAYTFFLNPTTSYTFTVTKDGYETATTTLIPTQTQYTIQLATSSQSVADYSNGVTTTIKPNIYELNNNTNYQFNLTISSNVWTITNFGFVLSNGSSLIGSVNSNSNGGFLSLTNNTANFTSIIMNYYYVINNTYSNGTYIWSVTNTEGNEYSLSNLFTDLRRYVNSGLFGLNAFGLGILVFVTIGLFTGILSYKYGITSGNGIMVVMWLILAFFDFVIGIVPNPLNAIPHFPTFFVAIILISIYLREVLY